MNKYKIKFQYSCSIRNLLKKKFKLKKEKPSDNYSLHCF